MAKQSFNRRIFLGALSLGTAHLMFLPPVLGRSPGRLSKDPLQVVKLGKSSLKTTLLGFGTGVKAGMRQSALTRQDREKSIAALRHAYDRGIRMFDNADTYGTHPLLAEAMKTMDREKLTLSSKIWYRNGSLPEEERPDADVAVERFRRELNTDYIDLVQLHCMTDENWSTTMRRQMDILENLKAKGIIRAHGVSVHSLEAMKDAVEEPWVDVLHARINPYGIAMDRPEPAEVVKVIGDLHQKGKGVIGMKLVGNGRLKDDSEKIDNSMKFVLGLGSVDMLIVGFESKEQIDNYLDRMGRTLKELS